MSRLFLDFGRPGMTARRAFRPTSRINALYVFSIARRYSSSAASSFDRVITDAIPTRTSS